LPIILNKSRNDKIISRDKKVGKNIRSTSKLF
jgi:hypothetical protein